MIRESRFYIGFILCCILVNLANSGTGAVTGGGGGDVITCRHHLRSLFFTKKSSVFLADTFSWFSKPTSLQGIEKHGLNYKLPQAFYRDVIFQALSETGKNQRVVQKYSQLFFIPSKKLKPFPDDNITQVPEGCDLEQLALQAIGSDTVFVSAYPYLLLHHLEHSLFKLHETKLAIRGLPGDTTPIRKSVLEFLNSKTFSDIFQNSLRSINYEKLKIEMHPLLLEYVHFACVSSHICSEFQSFSSFLKSPLLSKREDYPKESSEDVAFRPYWFSMHLKPLLIQSGYKLSRSDVLVKIGILLADSEENSMKKIKELLSSQLSLVKVESSD